MKRIYLYNNDHSVSLSLDEQDEVLEGNEKSIFEKLLIVQPFLLLKLIRRLKAYQPDVILLNGSRTLKYGALAKLFLSRKTRLIYRVIDSPKFWNTGALTKLFYKKIVIPAIDASVGVSHASLQDMKSLYGFTKKTTVIHRAVNFDHFKNVPDKTACRNLLNLSTDEFVVLFLGNLTSQKRPDRFVEIIRLLKKRIPNIHGAMVGDGPLKKETLALINKYELDQTITLYGYQQAVGQYIGASDVLLLTSDTEGLPGIVPESGYFSVPAIASNVGGVNECIQNGTSGFVVEKEDIDGFAEKVYLLFSDQHLRSQLGAVAQKTAENNFNIKNVSGAYLKFFESL